MAKVSEKLPIIDDTPGVDKTSKLYFKSIVLTLAFVLGFFLLTFIILSFLVYSKWHNFSQVTDLSFAELKTLVKTGMTQSPLMTEGRTNVLILGLDALDNRPNQPILTDSIILLSIDYKTGKIYLLSFPRDLWSEEYQSKINAFYFYGQEKYPDNPEKFTSEVIENLTQLPVHYTLILSLDQLAGLVEILDGVEINVDPGFVDEKFPNPQANISSSDEAQLYMKVEFLAGKQTLNEVQALQYVRSRHAAGDAGTDLARSKRQQQLILAIIHKILDPKIWLKDNNAAKFYLFYRDNFDKYLPIVEVLSIGKEFLPNKNNFNLLPVSLSIYPDEPIGVLTHPNNSKPYQNQWVYTIVDKLKFQEEVKSKLGY